MADRPHASSKISQHICYVAHMEMGSKRQPPVSVQKEPLGPQGEGKGGWGGSQNHRRRLGGFPTSLASNICFFHTSLAKWAQIMPLMQLEDHAQQKPSGKSRPSASTLRLTKINLKTQAKNKSKPKHTKDSF